MAFCFGSLSWLSVVVKLGSWTSLDVAQTRGCPATSQHKTDQLFVPVEQSVQTWKSEEVLKQSVCVCVCVCASEKYVGVSGLCQVLNDYFQNYPFINT